jgi:inosine-uridine nucleoside N-ribohydrolase
MRVELILVPYAATRDVLLNEADLNFIAAQGRAGAWMAERSRAWLDFWRSAVGVEGFYPFDLLAAAFLQDASRFRCASMVAWVGQDPTAAARSGTSGVGEQTPATPKLSGKAVCDGVTMPDVRLFTQ